MIKILYSPLVIYLVIGSFSLFAAWLMFQVGGSLAKISNQENTFIGFSFEAGGVFAGFILFFWLSLRTIQDLRNSLPSESRITLKVPVSPLPPVRLIRSVNYSCTYWLYDTETGQEREFPAQYTWEAGFLTGLSHLN